MASGPSAGRDRPQDYRAGGQMFSAWHHLQRTLGGSFNHNVKRSRSLARARLKRRLR